MSVSSGVFQAAIGQLKIARAERDKYKAERDEAIAFAKGFRDELWADDGMKSITNERDFALFLAKIDGGK